MTPEEQVRLRELEKAHASLEVMLRERLQHIVQDRQERDERRLREQKELHVRIGEMTTRMSEVCRRVATMEAGMNQLLQHNGISKSLWQDRGKVIVTGGSLTGTLGLLALEILQRLQLL